MSEFVATYFKHLMTYLLRAVPPGDCWFITMAAPF
jgi:hypothetical protein